MTTTILLARHGETDWNREGRFQGHADPTLNASGRAQARELGERLASISCDAVYSSDLLRAKETADIVASRFGLPVSTRSDLREADVGIFTGLTRAEIAVRFPDDAEIAVDVGFTGATGEGFERLAERVVAALLDVAVRHPGETVLVVTHGGPIRVALASADGMAIEDHRRRYPAAANGSVYRLDVVDGHLRRVD